MTLIDYNKYIGIPWECGKSTIYGADCWGIVMLVINDAMSIGLKHYGLDQCHNASKTFEDELLKELSCGRWEPVINPQELDVVMMISKNTGKPEHIGVYIGNNHILHSLTKERGISEVHHTRVISTLFKSLEYYRYVS